MSFKVAVFGDRMQDVYYIGEASRLSPEQPTIPVVKVNEVKTFPGGAGNVVANLEALGCQVIDYTNNPPFPVKSRLMVGDVQVARWDLNDNCHLSKEPVFGKFDAIVVADYGKGAINNDLIKKLGRLNSPKFVDTKSDPTPWSGVATAIFPNDKEWSQFELAYASFDGLVIGKHGKDGLTAYRNGQGVFTESPSQARFIRSVNGAGDTVMAAFVYIYLTIKNNYPENTPWKNDDYFACLEFANCAAAIACEHSYTYAPTLTEINERFYATN